MPRWMMPSASSARPSARHRQRSKRPCSSCLSRASSRCSKRGAFLPDACRGRSAPAPFVFRMQRGDASMARYRTLGVLVLFAATAAACASPLNPPPLDQVATSVAQTLAAVSTQPPILPSPVPTQPPAATPTPELLPHSLYYLNTDSAGLLQVFRLARDGKTVQQITFEPTNVDSFDVSPLDGSVAYGANNQLFLVDANGAGRRALVEGGPIDP